MTTDEGALFLRPGDEVDGFRIVRVLGSGGMGDVYLARDIRLGRKVALKVVRPRALANAESLERFMFEARVTARFSHPHIVTIYAVGEHRGAPYLALEYLDGQSLRNRMKEQSLSPRECFRVGLAITEALVEAHRHKVLHRDLKPENVHWPHDGRLRVLDFGLAKSVVADDERPSSEPEETARPLGADDERQTWSRFETSGDALMGTPVYMAPEQWRRRPCTPATDVWALGVILYELLCGRPPFVAPTLTGLCVEICKPLPAPALDAVEPVPAEVEQIVARCLTKDPAGRPTAEEVAEVLRGLLGRDRALLSGEDANPFRGLLPFTEHHADLFFGRDAEIAAFLERLRQEPVLPVVGPSGAGKSSFVQAGVIPRLREQGRWTVLHVRPGTDPFKALAGRLGRGESDSILRSAQGGATGSSQERREGEIQADESVADTIQKTLREQASDTLQGVPIVVPSNGEPEPARDHPLDLTRLRERLLEAPTVLSLILQGIAERNRSRVLLFVDQLDELYTLVPDEEVRRRFMEALCNGADDPSGPVRVIFTLRDDFLGRVAETTAAREALGHITVLRSPDQKALRETLENPLAVVGYGFEDPDLPTQMLDAVRGETACLPVLQFACSRLWERRDTERRVLTRAAYAAMGGVEGALTRLADDVLAGLTPVQTALARQIFLRLVTPEGTRRVVSRSGLLDGLGTGAEDVLDRLTASRAVLVRRGREGDAVLEIVHESLIRAWEPLRRWLDESRDEVAFLAEVGQAADLWEKRGRRDEEVWRGAALHEAVLHAARCTSLPDGVRRFLDAGTARESRTARRRRVLISGVMVVLFLVAVGFAVLAQVARVQGMRAVEQARRAEIHRAEAVSRHAQALRDGARAAFLQGETFEARAKLRESLEAEDSPVARALWGQLAREPLVWNKRLGGYGLALAVSPDGEDIATVCSWKSICVFSARSRQVRILRGLEARIYCLAYSGDGRSLASGSLDGDIGIWDLTEGRYRHLAKGDSRIRAPVYSPDGSLLLWADNTGRIHLQDLVGHDAPRVIEAHEGPVMDQSFAPDGRTLATSGLDGTVRLWDVGTWTVRRVLRGHDAAVGDVSFAPDGRTLASASEDRTVRIWDVATGTEQRKMAGHAGAVVHAAFSPDGRALASASYEGTIRLWDLRSGAPAKVLGVHPSGVVDLAFDPGGRYVATTGWDEELRLWDPVIPAVSEDTGGHDRFVWSADYSPDGRFIASVGNDRTVRIWDVETGRNVKVFRGHDDETTAVDISPDSRFVASGSSDNSVRIWNVETGAQEKILRGHTAIIYGVRFSPDGKTLASGSEDRTVRIWDVATGGEVATLGGDTEISGPVRFSPDGTLIAAGSRHGPVYLFPTDDRSSPAKLLGHTDWVMGVDFNPDGTLLASGSRDGTIRLWDVATRTLHSTIVHGKGVYGVELSGDGRRLAFASADHSGWIRDLGGDRAVELAGHLDEANVIHFSPDGLRAVTASDDSTVRLWDTRSGAPLWRTTVMLDDPPEIHTHAGWTALDASGGPAPLGAGSAWRRAIEDHARPSSAGAAGEVLCILGPGESLEVWDIDRDAQIVQQSIPGLRQVLALPAGCLALSGDVLSYIDRAGSRTELTRDVTAAARSGADVLVASGGDVVVLTPAGERREAHRVGAGATAVGRVAGRLVVGFYDGSFEVLRPETRGEGADALHFEDTPTSPVVAFAEGPMGIIVVGFANGVLGLWSTESGARLQDVRLHGPVRFIVVRGDRLHAASDLGQHVSIDLGLYSRDYCDLMREVWQVVPVVWVNGQPVARAPSDHRCAR